MGNRGEQENNERKKTIEDKKNEYVAESGATITKRARRKGWEAWGGVRDESKRERKGRNKEKWETEEV